MIASGLSELSSTEATFFALVARGLQTSQISEELGVTEYTAQFHVTNIIAKCGCRSRRQLLTLCERDAAVPVPEPREEIKTRPQRCWSWKARYEPAMGFEEIAVEMGLPSTLVQYIYVRAIWKIRREFRRRSISGELKLEAAQLDKLIRNGRRFGHRSPIVWEAVQRELDAGVPVSELAMKYSVSRKTIYNHCSHIAGPHPQGARLPSGAPIAWEAIQLERDAGATVTELAKKYSVSRKTIYNHSQTAGPRNDVQGARP